MWKNVIKYNRLLLLVLVILNFLISTPVNAETIAFVKTSEKSTKVDNSSHLKAFNEYELSKDEIVFETTEFVYDFIDPNDFTNLKAISMPGNRGTNQLIIYTSKSGKTTGTNEYGAEVVVDNNTVVELSGANSPIPSNGLVISGHGRAKDWINHNIKVGTKIFIDEDAKVIYAWTTSKSYIFDSEMKIQETKEMINFYKENSPNYNSKVPNSYIDDAEKYIKKAKKNQRDVKKYSKLAIEASNDAIKSVIPCKDSELKGVWLRPTEKSEREIEKTLDRIQKTGISDLFLETYFHGKTIFPSKTMEKYGFVVQNEKFAEIDALEIYIREAHKRKIKVHIWFETFYVGTQNPKDNPNSILGKNPEWGNKIKKDADLDTPSKSSSEHNGYFLDPANSEVQKFVIALLDEIITTYKPDGINLDYIRYPNVISNKNGTSWGYTKFARNEFKNIYGVDPVNVTPTDYLWSSWCKYRQSKVTSMVRKVSVLTKSNNVYSTAVIFPDKSSALDKKMQDWSLWSKSGFVNGFTPLFLTCDAKTVRLLMQEIINSKTIYTDFYAGLFVTFMGGSDEDLIRLIHEANKMKANGVIIFDYAHLSKKYAKTLSTSVFAPYSSYKKIEKADDNIVEDGKKDKKKKRKKFWQRKNNNKEDKVVS
ncbi:MAG: family 10 glycosylhydrolase [Candidatus Gastranaerophilales bacterium]